MLMVCNLEVCDAWMSPWRVLVLSNRRALMVWIILTVKHTQHPWKKKQLPCIDRIFCKPKQFTPHSINFEDSSNAVSTQAGSHGPASTGVAYIQPCQHQQISCGRAQSHNGICCPK